MRVTGDMDEGLLHILACPETRESVSPADRTLVDRINREIEAGKLVDRGGEQVTEPIDGGLVRRDRRYLYAIRRGVPVLLVEAAIPLEGLADGHGSGLPQP